MLAPKQVKPFILHDDVRVANFATEYFADSYLLDEELMPLFLQRLRRVKKDETYYLHHGYSFPHTQKTIEEVLELLNSTATDAQTQIHLSLTLMNADVPLLLAVMPEISAYSNNLAKAIQARIELAQFSDKQLIQQFNEFIESTEGKYYNEIDVRYGEELAKLLAVRAAIAEEEVLEALKPSESYSQIFYAKLAGELKLASAISLLIEMAALDDDVSPDVAVKALVKVGTDEVVRQAAQRFEADSEGDYRLFASDIFGKIKRPSSEQALFRLLEQEDDLTIATKLAAGLCELGSTDAIPIVRKRIDDGYDSGYLDLRQYLYVNCVMNGVDLPELAEWTADFDREAERIRQLKLGLQASQVKSTKVGRNDPCHCGSGKKFKKCCGA